jgi:hypothetical protein
MNNTDPDLAAASKRFTSANLTTDLAHLLSILKCEPNITLEQHIQLHALAQNCKVAGLSVTEFKAGLRNIVSAELCSSAVRRWMAMTAPVKNATNQASDAST